MLMYCCLVMNFNSGNGDFSSRLLRSDLGTPKFRAFKLMKIVMSFVISERCQNIFRSSEFNSSQSSFPYRYRTRVDRFPCEKTIQRRKVPLSLFIYCTMGKDFRGPRNEVKTSDGLVTRKTEELRFFLDISYPT